MSKHKKLSTGLADFVSENKLDQYLDGEFTRDFGFRVDPSQGPNLHSKKSNADRAITRGVSRLMARR